MFTHTRSLDIAAKAFMLSGFMGFLAALFLLGGRYPLPELTSAEAGSRIPFLPLLTLEKLFRQKLTDQPTRKKLNQAITENPGLTKSELSRLTSIPWSSLSYHISVLEQNRLIVALDNKFYFSSEQASQPGALLLTPLQLRILEEVKQNGYTSQRDLARRLNLSKTTLQRNLHKMYELDNSDD